MIIRYWMMLPLQMQLVAVPHATPGIPETSHVRPWFAQHGIVLLHA